MLNKFREIYRHYRIRNQKGANSFLRRVTNVIHVGANTGQEKDLYQKYGVSVVWIEPIPEVFAKLRQNLKDYPRQHAYQYLITDKDDASVLFHIANNEGASSSILNFSKHTNIWPEIQFEKTVSLQSITLKKFCEKEQLSLKNTALVMDTQGTELLVLRGAKELLHRFRFIKTEASDFEVYEDCCRDVDITRFLEEAGFREYFRKSFASKEGIGSCYDIVYKRYSCAGRLLLDFLRKPTVEQLQKTLGKMIRANLHRIGLISSILF